MKTYRKKNNRRNRSNRINRSKTKKTNKKWVTAIEAAQSNLRKTKSLTSAKNVLKIQAFKNVRKMFGNIGEKMIV